MPDSNSGGGNDAFAQGIGSFVKSVGSNAGRLMLDAFAGPSKGEALYQQKQQNTQAELKDAFSQKVERGELIDLDERRSWGAAGGDDSVIGAMNQTAIHNLKERGEAETFIETQHKLGMYSDSEANLYTTMIRNDNPTVQELGKATLNSQAKQQAEFMKYIFGEKLQEQKQAGAEKIEGEKLQGAAGIEQSHEGAAAGREQSREKTAMRIQQMRNTGKGPAFTKGLPGMKDALKTVNQGYSLDDEGNKTKLNAAQKEAQINLANMRMYKEGASQQDMLKGGGFSYTDPSDKEMHFAQGLEQLTAIIPANQQAGFKDAVKLLYKSMDDPTKFNVALQDVINRVPPDQQQAVYNQIMQMLQDVHDNVGDSVDDGSSGDGTNAEDDDE